MCCFYTSGKIDKETAVIVALEIAFNTGLGEEAAAHWILSPQHVCVRDADHV